MQTVKKYAARTGAEVVTISARLEEEIAELDAEEATACLEDLGFAESGLDRLIHGAFSLLGLQTFLTAGEDECRAWTITRGTTAPKAAGKIHTDFERGFIKAVAVVTKRIRPLKIDGKTIHHVGIPIHWGFKGMTRPGFLANTLTPFVGDGNSFTPEFKSFLVKVEKI